MVSVLSEEVIEFDFELMDLNGLIFCVDAG